MEQTTKVQRQFAAEIQYLKGGKYWTHLRTVVIPASSLTAAVARAGRIGKQALPKGTRNAGLLVKVTPAESVRVDEGGAQ
jgi:hypothetical protein